MALLPQQYFVERKDIEKMVGLRKEAVSFLMMVIVTMLCTECRNPVLHRVGGGRYSWAPNVNLSEWTLHEHFYVGDWLYFGFDKQKHNVLQVNKTSYENCIDKNFIMNITRGGRDVFNLTEVKPYYFINGRGGYCLKGMKVAVYVKNPLAPAPLFSNIASPSITCCHNVPLIALASVFFWAFLFKYI